MYLCTICFATARLEVLFNITNYFYVLKVYSRSWLVETRRIILDILKLSCYFICCRHQRVDNKVFLDRSSIQKSIIDRCGYQAPARSIACKQRAKIKSVNKMALSRFATLRPCPH